MSRRAVLALLATGVAAQANHAIAGFKYIGCVSADPSSFPMIVDFFAPFTPEQCQNACQGGAFAAMNGGCVCAIPDLADLKFDVLPESKCDNPCIKDTPAKGFCGGGGGKFYNLYKKEKKTPPTSTRSSSSSSHHHGGSTKTQTNTKTVTSCPPDKPDCPTKTPEPTHDDCEETTEPTPTPTKEPCKSSCGTPPPPPATTTSRVAVNAGARAEGALGMVAAVAGAFVFGQM